MQIVRKLYVRQMLLIVRRELVFPNIAIIFYTRTLAHKLRFVQFLDNSCWISGNNAISFRETLCHNTAGAHDSPWSKNDSRKDNGRTGQPAIVTYYGLLSHNLILIVHIVVSTDNYAVRANPNIISNKYFTASLYHTARPMPYTGTFAYYYPPPHFRPFMNRPIYVFPELKEPPFFKNL